MNLMGVEVGVGLSKKKKRERKVLHDACLNLDKAPFVSVLED